MKVLVVGSGAREHAIVWKLSLSPRVKEIYAAPGNAGTARLARNLAVKAEDIDGLARIARDTGASLIMVGPEAPLAQGIVDRFQTLGIPIFGPSKLAAEIESSKVFSRELCQKHGIPAARGMSFSDYESARAYLARQTPPIVVKADGLAAGKGVAVAQSIPEAQAFLKSVMLDRAFGAAGDRVIIEECLVGREMSAFAFSDGQTVVPMAAACDYKRVFDGDQGPNTGGMGSYSPPYFATPELYRRVTETILRPAVAAMAREGRPYKGVLYAGLMITKDGPKVMEFNARFGDPETQVVLPLLKTDLAEIMLAVVEGRLDKMKIEWRDDAALAVVMASGGYPASYKTDFPITGLDDVDKEITVFHAGTKLANERVVTSGGRVLSVVATGKTLSEARQKVYNNIARISFEGCHYRKDIGVIKGEQN